MDYLLAALVCVLLVERCVRTVLLVRDARRKERYEAVLPPLVAWLQYRLADEKRQVLDRRLVEEARVALDDMPPSQLFGLVDDARYPTVQSDHVDDEEEAF